ncbi:formyltransferase family protein [Clostridiaceae bacterium M8S5]|nr:formyltransferase family protein [Clostridiaceae bacterium M8S5]
MIITLLCDNPNSWIIPYVKKIFKELENYGNDVIYINDYKKIKRGDLAFFLGCEKIIPEKYLELNEHNLVIHESDLPQGKGWSPLTWQILENKNRITITLFEASTNVDAGDIYLQELIYLNGTELLSELKHKQGIYTEKLVLDYVNKYPNVKRRKQCGEESYYKKRTPEDSELDISNSIKEQFNLLRVVDNDRYPAFFRMNGHKYVLKIYKEQEIDE